MVGPFLTTSGVVYLQVQFYCEVNRLFIKARLVVQPPTIGHHQLTALQDKGEELRLCKRGLVHLPPGLDVATFPQLLRLDLSSNQLKEVPPSLFKVL